MAFATLRRRGAIVLEPASGRLTGADTGAGRLPEAEEITTLAQLLLDRGQINESHLLQARAVSAQTPRTVGKAGNGRASQAQTKIAAGSTIRPP